MTNLLRKIAETAEAESKTTLKQDVASLKSAITDLKKSLSPVISDGLRAKKKLSEIRKGVKEMPFYVRPEIKPDPRRAVKFLSMDRDKRHTVINTMGELKRNIKEINNSSWYEQPFTVFSNLSALLDLKKVLVSLGLAK